MKQVNQIRARHTEVDPAANVKEGTNAVEMGRKVKRHARTFDPKKERAVVDTAAKQQPVSTSYTSNKQRSTKLA